MKALAEKADFDSYVTRLLDQRQPGQLRILMDLYPQYVHERIQQSHTDHDFSLRNDLIDIWGINTFDDLHFQYLLDQRKISGPTLQRTTNMNAQCACDGNRSHLWQASSNLRSDQRHCGRRMGGEQMHKIMHRPAVQTNPLQRFFQY
eukprot:6188299-Pleurochrysis_carterae.AAC.1